MRVSLCGGVAAVYSHAGASVCSCFGRVVMRVSLCAAFAPMLFCGCLGVQVLRPWSDAGVSVCSIAPV